MPEITRINADGSNKVRIYNGFIPGPGGQWFSTILQPDVSPDGKTIAYLAPRDGVMNVWVAPAADPASDAREPRPAA